MIQSSDLRFNSYKMSFFLRKQMVKLLDHLFKIFPHSKVN